MFSKNLTELPPIQNGFSFDTVMVTIFVAAILLIFYFFIHTPQQKQKKKEEEFLKMLKIGDKVVTIGGINGVIVDINEEQILLEMNYNEVRILVERQAISSEATLHRYPQAKPTSKSVAPAKKEVKSKEKTAKKPTSPKPQK